MGRISKIKQKEKIMKHIRTYATHDEFVSDVPAEYDTMNLCKEDKQVHMNSPEIIEEDVK